VDASLSVTLESILGPGGNDIPRDPAGYLAGFRGAICKAAAS